MWLEMNLCMDFAQEVSAQQGVGAFWNHQEGMLNSLGPQLNFSVSGPWIALSASGPLYPALLGGDGPGTLC